MTTALRRVLLVSSTALIALTLVPVAGDMFPGSLSAYVDQQAQARGGDDDGDDGDDDSGGSSGSDHDSSDDDSDDDDDDSSGRDSHDDDDDDSSDDDDDDDSSDDSDDDYDDAYDDSDDRKGRGRGGDRDEIRLIVNEGQLQGLLSGSMIPVDQNGKRLGFEVEEEHGQKEIKLRAPKGTLTGVTVIPAP
ncbi:hypothetical protein ACSV9I_17025 [Rhizobium sp. G187]|uniref:hypothetical protein n=1 Tax=Rhizobium sp. G187 TaxID=3451352 RepID=UPI003EE4AC5C